MDKFFRPPGREGVISVDHQASSHSRKDTKENLCSRCERLPLYAENFIIGTPPVVVDSVAAHVGRYQSREANSGFIPRSGGCQENFATLQDLRQNQGRCAFCRLVCGAIERYSGGNTGPEKVNAKTICSLRWELHGQIVHSSEPVNRTRRICLTWTEQTGHAQEVFLLFVARKDAITRHNLDVRPLGRDPADQEGKLALVKRWFDICVRNHEDCRITHGTKKGFMELIEGTYFGVIDVVDMRLKSLPLDRSLRPERFVALSYVWGPRESDDDMSYVTTQSNVIDRMRHNGLRKIIHNLPKTLRDAMSLVFHLGYRYLWIDSLCIVQDFESSWRLNSQAMHLVYGNADFTICAADGKNSSAGLRAASTILPGRSRESTSNRVLNTEPLSEDVSDTVRLIATRSLEATINDSEWNQRAWTFQERVLSRRCLIFADGNVHFQCRRVTFSQDIYADGGESSSLERGSSPLRTLRELRERPLSFYLTYVRMYTGRRLTKPQDILAAFAGISWLLGRYMDAPLLFGLPTSHFDLAILWNPVTKIRRMAPRHPAYTGWAFQQDNAGSFPSYAERRSFESLGLPTWSWSGWMDGRIEYDPAMLEGCLLNVHEWLINHTWIEWYIRDEKGHLSALWGMILQGVERDTEIPIAAKQDTRWMGYPGRGSESQKCPDTSPIRMPEERQGHQSHKISPLSEGPLPDQYKRMSNSVYISTYSPQGVCGGETCTMNNTERSSHKLPDRKIGRNGNDCDDEDDYGRHNLKDKIYGEDSRVQEEFRAILPGSPFGVIRNTAPQSVADGQGQRSGTKATQGCMPILQFKTWRTELHVTIRDIAKSNASTGLHQCDILDKAGDWCGAIKLDDDLIRPRQLHIFQFIAISDAKGFTEEECPVWTYYIPKERKESEWDVYFVLLLERNLERGVWERAGLGKVFKAAFLLEQSWDEIKLG
ncbi:heterokaryon incompatibility protein-domain-containing protein [Durotheca rogersii]|uniref:heterokaryon incompatibility protein-domain-containing protein n=1 Tax=Durotheca rogersii TaxID=419775 RepID=UPI00221F2CCA|nr:heterokaryon incompatibility protein-domain-containing protein [Durotheca rogersii]KAI5860078.1 heterokaryon incompatibility protein-domain-containing protein [Durotheca rogersii]